jgi:hypothetical protein
MTTLNQINKQYGYERVAIVKPNGKLAILNQDGTIQRFIKKSELKNL